MSHTILNWCCCSELLLILAVETLPLTQDHLALLNGDGVTSHVSNLTR